ncbi:ribosomal protein L16 [Candidatus Korarchaeum cryptofilum OPF8]|uniref:Ribosomal protein L16 n=1 Tax=Korarchaeum cryptofilum (strain OPF8) TaxID=374847 RepID=B1L7Q3_KORCO|nr:ribosomal protein L16 [Candidatus Korarchaeum cryptofilum OPF8]
MRMVAEASFQVRSNALEAARMTVLSQVRKAIPSDEAYFFKVVHYPHHILRKHAMAGVHKAERLQKGMRLAFGKPDARAAQIRRGDVIMFMRVNEQHLEAAKYCMKLAKLKIPYMTRIDVVRLDGTEDEEGA